MKSIEIIKLKHQLKMKTEINPPSSKSPVISFSIPKSFILASNIIFSTWSLDINSNIMRQNVASASTLLTSVESKPNEQIYGLKKGRLLPCKMQSNCISSSSINSLEKYGRPWSFSKSPDEIYIELVKAIKSDNYLTLLTDDNEKNTNNVDLKYYIHATAKSAVPPTGLDDIEFLINPLDKIITYRSNSRELLMAGFSSVPDGGSSLNRLESVRRKLGLKEMQQSTEVDDYVKTVSNMNIISQMKMMSEPNDINFIDNSVPTDTVDDKTSSSSSSSSSELITEK